MRTKFAALLALGLLVGSAAQAEDTEAKNPGVKIEPQYLENEAYKAKLTTLLQSRDKPAMYYSWAGGVLRTQV